MDGMHNKTHQLIKAIDCLYEVDINFIVFIFCLYFIGSFASIYYFRVDYLMNRKSHNEKGKETLIPTDKVRLV